MFQWYRKADKCYAYLSDVSIAASDRMRALQESRWFTRGWTLQELLAPKSVDFFSVEGNRLGNKASLLREIHDITRISPEALQGVPLQNFSAETRLSWTKKRVTKREEDKAYYLLGIFNVYMPLIYGEGREHAFRRLREEIDKSSKNGLRYDSSLLGTPALRTPSFAGRETPCEHNVYFRYNVQQGLQSVGLPEYGEQTSSEAAMEEYVPLQEHFSNLRHSFRDLQPKENVDMLEWDRLAAQSYLDAATHCRKVRSQVIATGGNIRPSPLSEELAWFTNTNAYQSWAV